MTWPSSAIHDFQVHLIVRQVSRTAATDDVLSWLAEWFLRDLGSIGGGYPTGSLLHYWLECTSSQTTASELQEETQDAIAGKHPECLVPKQP